MKRLSVIDLRGNAHVRYLEVNVWKEGLRLYLDPEVTLAIHGEGRSAMRMRSLEDAGLLYLARSVPPASWARLGPIVLSEGGVIPIEIFEICQFAHCSLSVVGEGFDGEKRLRLPEGVLSKVANEHVVRLDWFGKVASKDRDVVSTVLQGSSLLRELWLDTESYLGCPLLVNPA